MYDIVIIGGGPGGYAAALYAHNFGLSVALVEKERPGGTCVLRGCIPAKQWLHTADVFSTVKHASDFGVMASEPEMDWAAALERKNKTVETLVGGLGSLLKNRGVDVINGYGRLAGPGQVIYWVANREAALTLDPWFVPVDDAIVGLVDEVRNYPPAELDP